MVEPTSWFRQGCATAQDFRPSTVRHGHDREIRLFESAPVALWQLDSDGNTICANALARELAQEGFASDGKAELLALLCGSQLHSFCKKLASCALTGHGFDIELNTVADKYVRLIVSASLDADGCVSGFEVACVDLSARKAADERLMALDVSGKVLGASLNYRVTVPQLLRAIRDEFCTLSCADISIDRETPIRLYPACDTPEEHAVCVAQIDYVYLAGGKETLQTKVLRDKRPVVTTVEGTSKAGRASVVVVPLAAEGKVIGTLTTLWPAGLCAPEDVAVTENLGRRVAMAIQSGRAHERLYDALETRQTFLAMVAHDVKNVVTCIGLRGEMLAAFADRAVVKHGDAIERLVVRMARMLDDLLDNVAIERGQLHMTPANHDVDPLLQDLCESHRSIAALRNIELRLSSQPAQIFCDAERCLQVLGNLLSNALKFAYSNSCVEVSVSVEDQWTTFRVANRGDGIPADNLSRIFDQYWQAKENGDRRGRGLGLFISSAIVKGWGGTIWADSVLKQSTVFCFTVPTAKTLHIR